MIKKAASASTFTGGSVSSAITSTVASGQNFLTCTQGARLNLGGSGRYFSDDGTNLAATGNFVPSASVTYELGGATKIWGAAYLHSVQLNGGIVQVIGANTLAKFRGNVTDGASAIAIKFGNGSSLTTAGSKIASFYSDDVTTERCFIDRIGQYENTGAGNGIILKSPDGTRYRLTIANGGTVSISAA